MARRSVEVDRAVRRIESDLRRALQDIADGRRDAVITGKTWRCHVEAETVLDDLRRSSGGSNGSAGTVALVT